MNLVYSIKIEYWTDLSAGAIDAFNSWSHILIDRSTQNFAFSTLRPMLRFYLVSLLKLGDNHPKSFFHLFRCYDI